MNTHALMDGLAVIVKYQYVLEFHPMIQLLFATHMVSVFPIIRAPVRVDGEGTVIVANFHVKYHQFMEQNVLVPTYTNVRMVG